MTEKEEIEKLKKRIEILERKDKENRKANVWKEVKEEFSEEFSKFKWIDTWSFTKANGQLITQKTEINEKNKVESAVGTLIRCALHKKRIALLEDKDKEKVKQITKEILEILLRGSENK